MTTESRSEQLQEAFCHPEQHQEAHEHAEHHEETLGAGAQQQPLQEAAAAPQMSEGEKKALQIHNQGRALVWPA